MSRVEDARRNFEESWDGLRRAVGGEIGGESLWGRRALGRGWVVGAVALAAGLALGMALRRRTRTDRDLSRSRAA